ncbi:MAG: GNAT family N-acetyltransferase [bacterium]
MTQIAIKIIKDIESMRRIEDLQMEIWGMPEREVVPSHQLLAASGAGGAVLAALEPDGTMVGFCYGFAGWRDGRPLFYSHMAGVKAARQLRDIGFRLKCAQREAAMAMGFDRAIWTFDPLLSVNARFNLHKLGATARRYHVNYYGEMPDALNRGLDSDRLEVDWALRSPRVVAATAGTPQTREWDHAPRALESVRHPLGAAPSQPNLTLAASAILVEIPTDFTAIRQRDHNLGQAWRLASREAFLHYLGRGYRAVDFLLHPEEPLRGEAERLRGMYVLVREPDED